MTTTTPQGPIRTPRGFGIDPRLGAAILRAPAFSREDSHRQAIFKFHHHSSLDYRACHGLPIMAFGNLSLKKYIFVYFDIQTQHRGILLAFLHCIFEPSANMHDQNCDEFDSAYQLNPKKQYRKSIPYLLFPIKVDKNIFCSRDL